MKHIHFVIILSFAVLIACNGNKSNYDEMTTEQAIEVVSAKIHKNDKDDALYYDRARLLMKAGRTNDAIVDLLHAIQLKDDKVEYRLLLADAYFANGDVEKSYDALGDVLELDPDNQEAILKQGEVAFYSRDYDRALTNLSKVTEQDPNNRQALFMKSFIYKEKGDTVNAVKLLRKVCDLYPDYAAAYEQLGVLYSEHHDPMAIDYLSTAIRLDSNNTNTYYVLAMFYQETGNYTLAEETYRQLLAKSPKNKEAWHNLGYIEMMYNDDDDVAIGYFDHALQCDSMYVEAYFSRGVAYESKGDRKHAANDFAKALQIDPTYQPAADGLKRVK